MAICKKCGKEFEGEGIYCTPCRWEMKWPSEILNAPELASRRKRSHNVKLLSIDRANATAIFESSGKGTYTATLENCDCKDFALGHGERPCKHILRLADELNLFSNEHFEADEEDYTIDNRQYLAPQLNATLGRILEAIAARENRILSEQVHIFLDDAVCQYLEENNLEFSINEFNECELKERI